MRSNHKFVIIIAIISFAILSSSSQAGSLRQTAELVPPETVVLVEIDNFSQLKQQFKKTNLYKLYKDPSMAAFFADARDKLKEKVKELDNDVIEAIVASGVFPEGRVAFALVLEQQAMESEHLPILVISQWGENTRKIKEAIDKMVEKAVEEGTYRQSEDYQGIEIVTITKELPPIQIPDLSKQTSNQNNVPTKTVQPTPEKTSYCFVDDCLLVSADPDIIKFTIAHIKGASSPTLAANANYRPTTKTVGPYHDINFYANITQVVKTFLAEDTSGQKQKMVSALGLDNVNSASYSVGVGRKPGASCSGKAFLKINGEKKGIFKMFEFESTPIKAPRFVPASVYSTTFINVNIQKIYTELYAILYGFNPMMAAMLQMPILPPSPDGQPGLELKRDFINHLGSQIFIAQSVNKPFSKGTAAAETLFAIAVNNRGALEKSVSLLHSKVIAPNNSEARRELLGHRLYLINPPSLPFLSGAMRPMQTSGTSKSAPVAQLAITITDTHLIVGSESAVERAIRTLSSTDAKSVDSAKWFISAKSTVPSVVGCGGLQDNTASCEFFWWLMKESGKTKTSVPFSGPSPINFTPQGFGKLANFDLLPEFDVVRKYFGLSSFYGISREDGFFFEFNYLNQSAMD